MPEEKIKRTDPIQPTNEITQSGKNIKTNTDKIIKIYNLIHKYFFKYIVFIITIIISFFIFQNILNNATTIINTQNHQFIIRQTELILNFNKLLRQNIENEDIKIQIIQGNISNSGNYIESMNNLISYKGYIVPRFFYIYKTFPLQPISYFDQPNYNIQELDNFINNVILAKKESNQKLEPNKQLPLQEGIINTFNLNCLLETKLYQKICDNYIANFLESFFVYNINSDYKGLKNVFDIISKRSEYKDILCDDIEKYIIYSNDTSTAIEELINNCNNQMIENFKKLKAFIEIQQQLENKQITTTIYNNNDINAYKLVSLLQMIYKDIINNRTSTTDILQYLGFLKEILKSDFIDAFYKDLVFQFNNTYIKLRIEDPDNLINKNGKSESNEIIKQISTINNGSELLGFKGLIYQIKNPNLISQPKPLIIITGNNFNEEQQTAILKLINNISYLKIKNQAFSGNQIFINTDIFINNKQYNQSKIKLDATFALQYQNNEFIVNKIKITDQNTLNAVFKQLLSQKTYSLNEIFEYIQQNYDLYNQTSQATSSNILCEKIKEKFINSNTTINSCTTDNIAISKKTNDITIDYSISFNNYNITSIIISNPEIQKDIIQKLNQIQTNDINFYDVISSIVYYQKPGTTTVEGSPNIIIVTEKIQNYLGIKINDIAEKDDKILIEFTVGGINFIGYYNINQSTIYPIYFKNIFSGNTPTKITNFSLSLDDESKTDIYNFISTPLDYIKNISPESYLLYQNFISNR